MFQWFTKSSVWVSLLFVIIAPNCFANPAADCAELLVQNRVEHHVEDLIRRYNIDPSQLEWTPNSQTPVVLHKNEHKNFVPEIPTDATVNVDPKKYDVVIVGAGPAGLTAAVYLTDQGKSVLLIERDDEVGGLASATGAAYSGGPTGIKQYNIFRHIGLGDYIKKLSIHEPIDSYYWNGKMYEDVWGEHSLEQLPASFLLFKEVLLEMAEKGFTTRDHARANSLDAIYMDQFLNNFPGWTKHLDSTKVRVAYQKFLQDSKIDRHDPMKDVREFLDLYGRSALGGPTSKVSARQFCNFYISELRARFTGAIGTGAITGALMKTLSKGHRNLRIVTGAPVGKINHRKGGAAVQYVINGEVVEARGKHIIFAAPLFVAAKTIVNLKKLDKEKAEAISSIKMTDYLVHEVHLKGHPFRLTYDLWVRMKDYNEKDPTDIILSRWMDPKIKGYEGMRNFEKDPEDDYGAVKIYHPIGTSDVNNFTKEKSLAYVEQALQHLRKTLGVYVEQSGQKMKIELVNSYRWAYSIHIVDTGYLKKEEALRRPLRNIEFANNNMITPELETAMELGYDAAMRVLQKLK